MEDDLLRVPELVTFEELELCAVSLPERGLGLGIHQSEEWLMTKRLFIEQREQGDYAIRRPKSERASGVRSTQGRAIERAREMEPDAVILVERVRHTQRGAPDKWRKP